MRDPFAGERRLLWKRSSWIGGDTTWFEETPPVTKVTKDNLDARQKIALSAVTCGKAWVHLHDSMYC
jgi:hypothetical protein